MVVPNMDVHYKQVNLEFTFTFYIYITKFFHLFIQSFIFQQSVVIGFNENFNIIFQTTL